MRICSKCNNYIPDNMNVCPKCGEENNPSSKQGYSPEELNIMMSKKLGKIAGCSFIILGIVVLLYGLVELVEFFYNSIKYEETSTARFVSLVDCEKYDNYNGYCDAKYVYEVNGVEYEIYKEFINEVSARGSFTVTYDLDNPNDAIFGEVHFPGTLILFVGGCMIVFGIFIFKNGYKRKKIGF